MGLVTGLKCSLLAMLCVTALAVILVSPAVPSPPTVVGKIHVLLSGVLAAMLPSTVSIAMLMAAALLPGSALLAPGAGGSGGPVSLPMRR